MEEVAYAVEAGELIAAGVRRAGMVEVGELLRRVMRNRGLGPTRRESQSFYRQAAVTSRCSL